MSGAVEMKRGEKPDAHALLKLEAEQTMEALREYIGRIGRSQNPPSTAAREWETQLNIRLKTHGDVVRRLLEETRNLNEQVIVMARANLEKD